MGAKEPTPRRVRMKSSDIAHGSGIRGSNRLTDDAQTLTRPHHVRRRTAGISMYMDETPIGASQLLYRRINHEIERSNLSDLVSCRCYRRSRHCREICRYPACNRLFILDGGRGIRPPLHRYIFQRYLKAAAILLNVKSSMRRSDRPSPGRRFSTVSRWRYSEGYPDG